MSSQLSSSKATTSKRSFHDMSVTSTTFNMTTKTSNKPLVIVIAGPTGVGKSAVAAKLCTSEFASNILQQHTKNNHNDVSATTTSTVGHIVSADSVQTYKGVQIGANKPTTEEREQTPHHLIDILDSKSVCLYNAADWMRDALHVIEKLTCIRRLYGNKNTEEGEDYGKSDDDESLDDEKNRRGGVEARERTVTIDKWLSETRKGNGEEQPIIPIVVGGTMMYLQWLVHGRPDAMKPSNTAVKKAADVISEFQSTPDDSHDAISGGNEENIKETELKTTMRGWEEAIAHASSLGPVFEKRVSRLSGGDWYRLRRTLEVAYTVIEEGASEDKINDLYNGQRQGGLDTLGYDVRCFFLCPDDRMAHTTVVDSRCEDMLMRGLLKETTDLRLSGQLPDAGQQARAIGYRQTLDYLQRQDFKPNDGQAFGAYLDEFTTATRRYAKKQMQWFRRDQKFMFVPVKITDSSSDRVDAAADMIQQMCSLSVKEYEKELGLDYGTSEKGGDENKQISISSQTKKMNEQQGKKMKFYIAKRHLLIVDSDEYKEVIDEADDCTQRIQNPN